MPFKNLTEQQLQLIREGVPERKFGGLRGFFAWLERKKYKMHIRVFLSRWRSYRTCPVCNGARLRPEALATQVGGLNIAQVCALKIRDAIDFVRNLQLAEWQRAVGRIDARAGAGPARLLGRRGSWIISRSIDRCAR